MLELSQDYTIFFAFLLLGCCSLVFGSALGFASYKYKSDIPSVFKAAAIALCFAGVSTLILAVFLSR